MWWKSTVRPVVGRTSNSAESRREPIANRQPDKQESDMRHKVWESCLNSVNPVAARKGDV